MPRCYFFSKKCVSVSFPFSGWFFFFQSSIRHFLIMQIEWIGGVSEKSKPPPAAVISASFRGFCVIYLPVWKKNYYLSFFSVKEKLYHVIFYRKIHLPTPQKNHRGLGVSYHISQCVSRRFKNLKRFFVFFCCVCACDCTASKRWLILKNNVVRAGTTLWTHTFLLKLFVYFISKINHNWIWVFETNV